MPDHPLDSLTGAYSRAALAPSIQRALDDSTLSGNPFSLLMLDLDYMKSINDAFGHLRGDQVLVEVVQRIQAMVCKEDEVFRFGGDEFVVLLPTSAGPAARRIAERIQNSLQKQSVAGEPPITVSISLGLVTFPEEALTPENLFEIVDRRLYEGKASGRGRIIDRESTLTEKFGPVLRPPDRIIERDYALQQTRQLLLRLPETRRVVMQVRGPEGVGRTRFLAEFVKIALLQGYAVWQVRGSAALHARPRGALFQMQQKSGWINTCCGGDDLVLAIQAWVADKEASGLLINLDDIEGIDLSTLEELTAILNKDLPFPVAIAYSGDPSPEASYLFGETLLQQAIELEALTERGLQAWVRSSLRWEAPPSFISWLYRQTGGLPGFIACGLLWLAAKGLLGSEVDGWSTAGLDGVIDLAAQSAVLLKPIHNLPRRFSTFWGRESEIRQIKSALQTQPVVTLCGPDGIGKTRLAQQIAGESLDDFPDGIYWAVTGEDENEDRSIQMMAEFFHQGGGLPDAAAQAVHLAAYFRTRKTLLVLDGLEGTPPLVKQLSGWIETSPGLRVLVTRTNRPLGFAGESVFELHGLPLPDSKQERACKEAAAVQMFVENSRAEQANLTTSPEDLHWILRICRLVEGMPLGIELAAAWVSILTYEEIAGEIEHNLRFLTASGEKGQRSMVAVFESTWQLFSPIEQAQIESLSLFRDEFSQEAAGYVAGASLFFLDALTAKKILRSTNQGRFTMHRLMANYAADQFNDHWERQSPARRKFAEYYLRLAERTGAEINKSHDRTPSLVQDLPNFRRAWDMASGEKWFDLLALGEQGMFLIVSHLGRFQEGIAMAVSTLAVLPGSMQVMQIRLKATLGELYFHTGQRDLEKNILEEALDEVQALAEPAEHARILRLLANLKISQGSYLEALTLLEEGFWIAGPLAQPELMFALHNRAGVAAFFLRDYVQATRHFQLSLEAARAVEDQNSVAVCLNNLGDVAIEQMDFARARPLLQESLAICSGRSMTTLQGSVLTSLGALELADGQCAAAAGYFTQALRCIQDMDAEPLELEILSKVAELWFKDGKGVKAESLARVVAGHPASPHDIRLRVLELVGKWVNNAVENPAPAWQPGQLRRVVVDILDLLQKYTEDD